MVKAVCTTTVQRIVDVLTHFGSCICKSFAALIEATLVFDTLHVPVYISVHEKLHSAK